MKHLFPWLKEVGMSKDEIFVTRIENDLESLRLHRMRCLHQKALIDAEIEACEIKINKLEGMVRPFKHGLVPAGT